MTKYISKASFLLMAAFLTSHAAAAEPNLLACSLEKANEGFKGTCTVPCMVNALAIDIDGPNPKVSCNTPPREVAVTLRPIDGSANWLGTMEGKFAEDPTRFELTKGKDATSGVAKTPFGWFALQNVSLDGGKMSLAIGGNKTLPPTQDDIRIIQRALQLVANEAVWNRQDNRICPPNPQKWSVFCALTQATTEISGGVHYRQPALQAVREVLNEVGGTRIDKHRLMDYNNHPDTTLAEIHSLLTTSQARLEKRFH